MTNTETPTTPPAVPATGSGAFPPIIMSGFTIIIHDRPIGQKQVRFPKTKKKRIRKKWASRPQNFKPVFLAQPLIDHASKRIICTSRMAEQLRRAIA